MPRLRVATFNIHHGEGADGRVDIGRIAEVVTGLRADVVALQELDTGMERSGYEDQPARLGDLTGLSIRFCPTLHRHGGAYGIAVASVRPLEVVFEALPRTATEEPRGLIRTGLEGITIFATHLSTQRRPRRRQMSALMEAVTAADGPVVVAGDLNQPLWGLVPLLRAGLRPALAPTAREWALGGRQVDHVLVCGGLRIGSCRRPETRASDHRPLVAEVQSG